MERCIGRLGIWKDDDGYTVVSNTCGTEMGTFQDLEEAIEFCFLYNTDNESHNRDT
jgi:hypothetical protein